MTVTQKQIAYQIIAITEQLLLYIYPSYRMACDAEFEESKHPRKKDGKFASKGQGEKRDNFSSQGEATKSKQKAHPAEENSPIRRIYGTLEAGGGNYSTELGNKYHGTSRLSNGKVYDEYSAEIPKNKTNDLQIFATPYSHKYVQNSIMPDGRVVLNSGVMNEGNRWNAISSMVESEIGILGGAIKEGEFYRGTDNPKEADIAKSGKLRASINHRTDKKEDGVSVWERMNYASHKYTYKIKGKIIGVGSDGEPLLDPKSIKVISKIEPTMKVLSEYQKKQKEGAEIFKKKYGWSQKQINAALGTLGPESAKVEKFDL